MLCERCNQREATVHTTTVAGDNTKTVNLCAECFEGTDPDMVSHFQEGCHYCGGEFNCTAPDLSAASFGKQKLWALCSRCAEEYYGYYNRKLPGLGAAKLTPEHVSQLPDFLAELDWHMKQWVSEKDS